MFRRIRQVGSADDGRRPARLAPIVVVALLPVLAACFEVTTPPGEATSYLGTWSGTDVKLTVEPSRIIYDRRGGYFSFRHVESAFLGLSGNDIVYGGGGKKKRLEVSVAPHRDGAVWKMTVEGVELQRAAP